MKRSLKQMLTFLLLGVMPVLMAGCTPKETKEAAPTPEVVRREPVRYTSKDGNMVIDLPDDTWSADEESQELYMFTSADGLISVSHSDGEGLYPETEESLREILEQEGYISRDYKVLEFETTEIATMRSYKAVLQYDSSSIAYQYGILYGTILADDAYLAAAMLTAKDTEVLEAVKDSLYGYHWVQAEELDPEEIVSPKPAPEEATPEPTPEATPEPTPEATPEPIPEATPEPTPEATPEPTPEATPEPSENITALDRSGLCVSAAYVRSQPNNTSQILGSLEEGQSVAITGEVRNWYRIVYEGGTAYICKDYMQ